MKMLASLLRLWRRLPESIQERIHRTLRPTGIPYLASYAAKYQHSHGLKNFAGNLPLVKRAYLESAGREKETWLEQFHDIIDNLVMRNGVTKTTYSMRQAKILLRVLSDERCRVKKEAIRVLDIPSSVGTASIDIYGLLSKHYKINSYVLGDLFLHIYCDLERGCIYDEEWNLLQVKFAGQFFSIYRPHVSGDVYSILAYCFMLPVNVFSWYLKQRYKRVASNDYCPIVLIHPEVECRLSDGVFKVVKMDVFKDIDEKFDMIISFNLLQRSYFQDELIQLGTINLTNALTEGGLLIMGNTESFAVARKVDGKLFLIEKEGDF